MDTEQSVFKSVTVKSLLSNRNFKCDYTIDPENEKVCGNTAKFVIRNTEKSIFRCKMHMRDTWLDMAGVNYE